MKNNRLNYVIVGAFVLLVLAGLVASVALLTGRTGATDDYFAIYKNVTGVAFGSRVLFEGFPHRPGGTDHTHRRRRAGKIPR